MFTGPPEIVEETRIGDFRSWLTFVHPERARQYDRATYHELTKWMVQVFRKGPTSLHRVRMEMRAVHHRNENMLPDGHRHGPYDTQGHDTPMMYVETIVLRPGLVFHQFLPAWPRYTCVNGWKLFTIRGAHRFEQDELVHEPFENEYGCMTLEVKPSSPGRYMGRLGEENTGWKYIEWDHAPIDGPVAYTWAPDVTELKLESELVPVVLPTPADFAQASGLPTVLANMIHHYWEYEQVARYVLVQDDHIAHRTRRQTRTAMGKRKR